MSAGSRALRLCFEGIPPSRGNLVLRDLHIEGGHEPTGARQWSYFVEVRRSILRYHADGNLCRPRRYGDGSREAASISAFDSQEASLPFPLEAALKERLTSTGKRIARFLQVVLAVNLNDMRYTRELGGLGLGNVFGAGGMNHRIGWWLLGSGHRLRWSSRGCGHLRLRVDD
jgi:hypothetical protein